MSRILDIVLLVVIVAAPWAFLTYALSRFRDILRRDWWVLLLLAVTLGLFLTSLLSPLTETFVQAIIHSTPKPWFAAYTEAVRNGYAPLWLQELGTGLPALANPYVGYMTPFTSILLLFDNLDHGVNVLVLVHIVFAGVSGYLLGRSLGLSRVPALFLVLPLIWNPWVFRRLGTEIHALYIFGFAWLPLTWALVQQFIRTKAFADAVATGIPLAFMVVSMPTVFAQTAFAVAFFVAGTVTWELFRRRWRSALRATLGGLLIVLASFLAAAPEHLAARALFQTTSDTRFIPSRIQGGWRDRDLSIREFVRVLLPHRLGALVASLPYRVDAFGVPFSPGDAVVVVAAVGAGGLLLRRFRVLRKIHLLHVLLFLVLASMATHGPLYEPVHRIFPLWGLAGNFPVIGALLLLILGVWFGFGVETIRLTTTAAFRLLRARLTKHPGTDALWTGTRRLLLAALGALLVAELLWGIETMVTARRGADPDGRPDLRLTITTMPLEHLARLPHMAYLKTLTKDAKFPARIYCTGDRPVWPSPCFDYAVGRARTELVAPGELAWAQPRWQWDVFRELGGTWDGTLSPLLDHLLRLASVQYLVSTRELPFPLLKKLPWDPGPGEFQLYGKFLASSIGGGPWNEAWDSQIRIHAFPGLPRVFFADAIQVSGEEQRADSAIREILARADFDPRALALLHGSTRAEAPSFPTLDATADPANRAAFIHQQKPGGLPAVKLQIRSPRPGTWSAQGQIPHPGVLVFSQLYYQGLRATVNGRPAPALRADLFFTAVPVPAGDAAVTLEYVPVGILFSGVLTGSYALLLGIATFYPAGMRRHRIFPQPLKVF